MSRRNVSREAFVSSTSRSRLSCLLTLSSARIKWCRSLAHMAYAALVVWRADYMRRVFGSKVASCKAAAQATARGRVFPATDVLRHGAAVGESATRRQVHRRRRFAVHEVLIALIRRCLERRNGRQQRTRVRVRRRAEQLLVAA